VVTTTIAASVRTLRRNKLAPPKTARIAPSPAEARLLALRLPAAIPVDGGAGQFAQAATRSSVSTQPTPRARRRRRSYVGLVFWVAVLTLYAVGYYVIDRGGRAAPLGPTASAPFSASAVGSGRLIVPMSAGDSVVRVAVESATPAEEGWFWCFESSPGLPAAQHYCSSTGVRDPTTGYLTSNGVVHVDSGSLARGTTFYVQLYCPDDCRWKAEVLHTSSAMSLH
jgi:hypothetical protein